MKVYKLTIIFIHICDLLISLHLISLSTADIVYGESYIGYDKLWRGSFSCHALSFISLFTNILSQVLLTFLAFSRYDLVKNPLDSKVSEVNFVK